MCIKFLLRDVSAPKQFASVNFSQRKNTQYIFFSCSSNNHIHLCHYRSQQSCGKVMFQLCLSVHREVLHVTTTNDVTGQSQVTWVPKTCKNMFTWGPPMALDTLPSDLFKLVHYVAQTCQQAGGWHSIQMRSCFGNKFRKSSHVV